VHDLGVTVLVAEHRLERVVQYADRVLHLPGDGTVTSGAPAEVLATSTVAPPVVELGRLAGWSPLPMSVRDARRLAAPLSARLGHRRPAGRGHRPLDRAMAPVLTARGVTVRHGAVTAVRAVDLELRPGEVVGLLGRNGSGKSSLLWALQGSGPRQQGRVEVDGRDPGAAGAGEARRLVGLVPQTPGDLLYLASVDRECAQADADAGRAEGTCRALLDRFVAGIVGDVHPRDLSEGQRLALALAVQLCADPAVVLLDEPTRGLDQHAKEGLRSVIAELAAAGRPVVVATHDVEFVAAAADRVLVMAEGEVVADGPTAEVVVASPAFAPQVAKILSPQQWLTVAEVAAALDEVPA
jgi:energy-coupling factor transport system ATP-binding protein